MPISDFYECMLYEQLEPFGGRRGDLQAGLIASTIANANRGKTTKPFVPKDFMPEWDAKPEPVQTPEKQLEFFQWLQATHNARLKPQ
jgi:Protein of unknown function (DUF4035)